MEIKDLNKFIVEFFANHDCEVNVNNQNIIEIELTKEMDQAIMNRPFYWHYMKNIGSIGVPMTLKLTTQQDKLDQKTELIHFGSPRLHQLFNYLNTHNKFTCLYENLSASQQTPLYPWLVTNLKLSYQGRFVKEEVFSIGVNLMNGEMKTDMMHLLDHLSFELGIPHYCYPITPMLHQRTGFNKIEEVFKRYVKEQDMQWVTDSHKMMQEEIDQLKHFYDNQDMDYEHFEKDIKGIKERYEPSVSLEYINAGLFYLSSPLKQKAGIS